MFVSNIIKIMLTPTKHKVLRFINTYSDKNGYSPSLEEIKNGLNLSSISTVHQHVKELEKTGHLLKKSKLHRSIEIPRNEEMIRIFISGNIAAGQPIEAIEIPEETITVTRKEVGQGDNYYALRVQGDSMIEDGIFNGDLVVIRKQEAAEDGQTVVAIIDDNEATLKRIHREKGRFRLQPANRTMEPLFRKEVEVRGVVVKIIRNIEEQEQDQTFSYKKNVFLEKIRSSNSNSKNKYKRVALSPIRYAGGKSLAVGHVLELVPDNIKRIVSPFFGGGSIEIAAAQELGLEVMGYDVFDILCNYWKHQIEKPEILHKELKKLKPNKTTFEKIRLILNDVWKKKVKLDPLKLAVYYVYNFNLSYGPGFMGWSSEIYLNEKRYKRMLENIRDFKPGNLNVSCADFREVMKKHTNDFLYLDPPYYIGEGSKMFKGIYPMRNIPVHHKNFPHEELRDLLKKHKGGFILSYNNCSTVQEYYKDFEFSYPTWQYTMGQGETRIGLNRKNAKGNHIKDSHEVIIYCPPKL